MGVFSWMTSDTGESIPVHGNVTCRKTFTVYMKDDQGHTWREDKYDGYGVFGGMDYYDLVFNMNADHPAMEHSKEEAIFGGKRGVGIWMAHNPPKTGKGSRTPIKFPTLSRSDGFGWSADAAPKSCPEQGYFYGW